jgi:hypothetical protein
MIGRRVRRRAGPDADSLSEIETKYSGWAAHNLVHVLNELSWVDILIIIFV